MTLCRTIMRVWAIGALAAGAGVALGGCTGASGAAAGGTQSTAAAATQTAGGGTAGTAGAGTASQTSSTLAGGGTSGGTSTSTSTGPSGGTGTGSANDTSSGGAACGNSQLSVQLTAPDASVGHRSMVLLFTNTSGTACTISGYPGAAVTDKSGKVVLNAKRSLAGYEGGAAGVTTVTLSPGGHASGVIEWLGFPTDGQSSTSANCPGMGGGSLLVTPPNTTKSSSFGAPSDLCADFSVHPVVAGTSGRSRS